ncbi:MAG: RNA polymerase sigma factor RpoD/SigA [Candidatus Pedobacter colombiensis]|uniref:RNA polymerase sigma factor RpoD/SigA n=1 Tax=Candidatus Pedobacter colombiensis TaxID=3121371 RepID=A0AAJ6B7Q8_9SPHI|nr:RNA polymerase sigma factor RpoD/SigA [Pedobacter sp.]WEK20550.1 MAG: RNA polymerase sigma factor RpoD/SigA [Pedobacter sp.]
MRQLKIEQSITNRDSDSIEKYLYDIARIDLLSVEEEIVLAQKIRNGDQLALDRLVKANLRFVVSVAKKYQNQGIRLSDLIAEGNLGLIKAAQRFDETKGFKFISFAVWWIRQSIMLAIAEQRRMVRLPANQIGGIMKINKAMSELEQRLERIPTLEEVCEFIELPEEKVVDFLHHAPMTTSLDAVITEESGFTLAETIEDTNVEKTDTSVLQSSILVDIKRLMKRLPEREKEILSMFYGLGGNSAIGLDEIGSKMKLGKERVRQIKDKALKTLRSEKPKAYMMEYI